MEPPPSASGDVASQLQLEWDSRGETETEADSRGETESTPQEEKKLRHRGPAGVPGEDKEPKTEEEKWLIHPSGVE